MARPWRIQYPGAFYHVMNRGINHCRIFSNAEGDRQLFLTTLADAVQFWKIKIHAYSLMDNHYHLLIETPLPNLSRAMKHIDGVYTQRFNHQAGRDGPLFRGRFKSNLVQKESYFLELVRYIHLNGVKAGQYPSAKDDPYCSHPTYLNSKLRPIWLTTDTTLSFFEPAPHPLALLDKFVQAGVPTELQKTLDAHNWPPILGLTSFVEDIRKRYLGEDKTWRDKPQKKTLIKTTLPHPDEVLAHVCEFYGVEQNQVLTSKNKRTGRIKEARQAAIYFLRTECQLSFSDLGRKFGGVTDAAISRIHWKQTRCPPPTLIQAGSTINKSPTDNS
jgi:putative transposase